MLTICLHADKKLAYGPVRNFIPASTLARRDWTR
jgi:hypothetical protein